MILLFALLGLVVGSFIGAYTYRYPKGISIARGRSFCPKCGQGIAWFDNLPVVSYFLLKGRCRACGRQISLRYPLIELGCAIGFVALAPNILSIFIFSVLLAIFIIDLEAMTIPDELVFLGLLVTLLVYFFQDFNFYANLLTGLGAAGFLLLVNLLTRGQGMGLGDVKLAILLGVILGPINALSWLLLAFWLGAGVGLVLLILGQAKWKQKVAFGPFLIASFFVILKWGWVINRVLHL
jgi:leader peptidase (prepilin peptidase)/N-methyltransferase